MDQTITINSINYDGEIAEIIFNPDNETIVINLSAHTLPYTFDSSLLNPPREIYGTPTPTSTCYPTPTPTPTVTPSSLPALPGVYYGKFNSTLITSADTLSLTFVTTNDITNTYVTFSAGTGFGYVLIPPSLPQPINFKDSDTGCTGNDVPVNNIGTVVVLDTNGFAITYNIYRTFFPFNGQLFCWLCG
mgnify:CR=1 FL=1